MIQKALNEQISMVLRKVTGKRTLIVTSLNCSLKLS